VSDVIVNVPITPDIHFRGDDDLDCPYIGYTRVVPRDGYIDVPNEFVHSVKAG
jgi:hypothetical protein